jgi:hypothetical protein
MLGFGVETVTVATKKSRVFWDVRLYSKGYALQNTVLSTTYRASNPTRHYHS